MKKLDINLTGVRTYAEHGPKMKLGQAPPKRRVKPKYCCRCNDPANFPRHDQALIKTGELPLTDEEIELGNKR